MILTASLIALSVLVSEATPASAHRPGLHPKGSLTTPWLHWRGFLIRETNEVRSARCLSELRPRFPDGSLPVGLRRYAVVQWLEKWRNAREAKSRCKPWPASWENDALCVHSREGAWDANTGNGYYGGMQMDLQFQRTHGPDFLARYGTANHWSSFVQLLVSWRAYSGTGPGNYGPRGWHPWPNTARACGLL